MPDPTGYDPDWGGMDPLAGLADLARLGSAVDGARAALVADAGDRVIDVKAAALEGQRHLYALAAPMADRTETDVRRAKVSLAADGIERTGALANAVDGARAAVGAPAGLALPPGPPVIVHGGILPPVGPAAVNVPAGPPFTLPGTTITVPGPGPGPPPVGPPPPPPPPECPPPPPPPPPPCPPPVVICPPCPEPPPPPPPPAEGAACQLTRPCAPLDTTLQDACAWAAGIDEPGYRLKYKDWTGELSYLMKATLQDLADEVLARAVDLESAESTWPEDQWT